MKIGAENRTKTIIAVVLLAVGLFVFVRMLITPAAPQGTAATTDRTNEALANAGGASQTPAARARAAARDARGRYVAAPLTPSLDPRLRLDLLKGSEQARYEGAGRNIFAENLQEIPQPVGPGLKNGKKPGPQPPPLPPGPPPITVKFFGWATRPGEPKAVFLVDGDATFVAREGDIVNRRYKIVKINPNNVEIEDMLSNNHQSIPLTQG